MSSSPGPISTAAVPPSPRSIASRQSPATAPVEVSGNQSTPASGTAAPTEPATDSPTARVSTPAPTRSAAWPASIAAPGALRAPPITSTRPRLFLSPSGIGSGQSRSAAGVRICSAGGIDLSRVLGGRGAEGLQVLVVVVHGGSPLAVSPVADQPAHRGVGHRAGAGDLEDTLLVELLADVAEQQDDRVVRHDQVP